MRAALYVFCVVWILHALPDARAQDIPSDCMVTFNVKDKNFTTGNATMSCRLFESKRDDLSRQILATPDTGEIDGAIVGKQLDGIETTLKEDENAGNWVGFGAAITGNVLATIALGACLETLDMNCVMAGISKILSIYSVIDAGDSEAQKTKKAEQVHGEIQAIRQGIAGKKSKAKAIRDQMILDATQMCRIVQAQCL